MLINFRLILDTDNTTVAARLCFFLLSLVFISALSACSGAIKTAQPAATFHINSIQNKTSAGLYIYRPPTMANRFYSVQIAIDHSAPFQLDTGQRHYLQLPTGTHQIHLTNADNFTGKHQIHLTMTPGKTFFVRIGTSLNMAPGNTYQPYKRSFSLQPVSKKTAVEQINQCCFSKKSQKKLAQEKEQQEQPSPKTDVGFSIEKTNDPFSQNKNR